MLRTAFINKETKTLHLNALQKLNLQDGTHVGFGIKGNILYVAKRDKPSSAKQLWNDISGRTKTRKMAARMALLGLERKIAGIPGASESDEVIGMLHKVGRQLAGSYSVDVQEFGQLVDAVTKLEQANAEKARQQRVDIALKSAAQLASADAADFLEPLSQENLSSLAEALSTDTQCVKDFQSFIKQTGAPGSAMPPNYALAREFAKSWARLAARKPDAFDRFPFNHHLIDSLVKLVIQGDGIEAPERPEPALPQHQWVDEDTLSIHGQTFTRDHGDAIGKGGCGSVHIYRFADKCVVAKRLASADGQSHENEAAAEARAHSQAKSGDSDHVVGIHGTVPTPDGGLLLVLEYAPNGDSLQVELNIESALAKGELDKKAGLNAKMLMFADMVKGVAQAHAHGVIHHDLKPDNFFVNNEGKLLLGDFGISRRGLAEIVTSSIDSPDFTAPERVSSRKQEALISHRADIWSLGVLLYELNSPRIADPEPNAADLLSPSRPFPYKFSYEGFELVTEFAQKNERGRLEQLKLDVDKPLHQLILKMLDPDPLKRPPLEEILASPLIAPYANPRGKSQRSMVREARKLILKQAQAPAAMQT